MLQIPTFILQKAGTETQLVISGVSKDTGLFLSTQYAD